MVRLRRKVPRDRPAGIWH